MNVPIARRADDVVSRIISDAPAEFSDALWTLAPMIVQVYAEAGIGTPDASRGTVFKRRARTGLANLRRAARIRLVSTEAALFLMESVNERRVMEPILGDDTLPVSSFTIRTFRARPVSTGHAKPVAASVYQRLTDEIGRPAGLAGVFIDRPSLTRNLAVAKRTLDEVRALLTQARPQAVVVGSPMNPLARAMVLVSRELGIPSVYIPHAPAANQPWYEDLATDYAGLRGMGEVDFYSALGAPTAGLTAVGLPYLTEADPPPLDASLPSVFAPSPIAAPLFKRLIDIVAEGAGDNVIVSPHPRQSVAVLRTQMPRTWKFASDVSTVELLERGHPRVIVHNSGVALEALRSGIPSIHIELEGSPSTYVMYDSGAVSTASSADALATLCSSVVSDEERVKLIDVARHWASPVGAESAEAGKALIARAVAEGPRSGPLLDHWKRRQR